MKQISRRQFLKGLGMSPLVAALGCSNIFPIEEPKDYLPISIYHDSGTKVKYPYSLPGNSIDLSKIAL